MEAPFGTSSLAIERAILRLLGVGGTGPGNVPVPELFLERLGLERLAAGAARTLGALVAATGRTGDDVASAIAGGTLDVAAADEASEDGAWRALSRTVARVFVSFDLSRDARNRFGGAPATIVPAAGRAIVRADHFRDDRIAALAAIETHVRTVAYAPPVFDGPLESTWYDALLDRVRLLRESLDAMADRVGAYVALEVDANGRYAPEIAVMAALERVDVLSGIAESGAQARFARALARRAGVTVARTARPIDDTATDADTFAVSAGYRNPFADGLRFARDP